MQIIFCYSLFLIFSLHAVFYHTYLVLHVLTHAIPYSILKHGSKYQEEMDYVDKYFRAIMPHLLVVVLMPLSPSSPLKYGFAVPP
jgi:hypothetical protein